MSAGAAPAETLRIAVFHTELSRDGPGLMLRDILGRDEQVAAVAAVIRSADADVLVLGDIDYDLNGVALARLAGMAGGYPYRFAAMPNRGMQSGRDLDGDGRSGGPGDAEGYGDFAGQGGMAVLSRLPFGEVRDFSPFAWTDLPGHLAVGDARDPGRLSTTAHWDVPVLLPDGSAVHLLTWHATAPVFDGPEDRNGRRNHDEAAFWSAYLNGRLPWPPPTDFVLAGFANADPERGEARPGALLALLSDPRIRDTGPASPAGGTATVGWPEGPGRMRVDYVLPAMHMTVAGSGILWPRDGLLGREVRRASRHRLVWVDLDMGDRLADRRQRIGGAEARQE